MNPFDMPEAVGHALSEIARLRSVTEARRKERDRAVDKLISLAEEAEPEIAIPLLNAAKAILEERS